MKTKIISIKENSMTFYFLLAGIVFFCAFYFYCIDLTVRNGISHNDIEAELSELENRLSELEYQYIALQNSVTIESAGSLGLVEPAEKIFIAKSSSGQLSLNN